MLINERLDRLGENPFTRLNALLAPITPRANQRPVLLSVGEPQLPAPALIADGKLRPLAVSSLTRIGALPDIPTMSEAGLKDFEAVSWHMIVAAAGTPKPIVDRLNAAFKTITASEDFKQQTLRMGLDAVQTPSPEETRRYLDSEITRWGQLVKDVGLAGTQ